MRPHEEMVQETSASRTARRQTELLEAILAELRLGNSEKKEILSVEEVAELIGISVETIYKYTSQKRIPHSKVGKRCRFFRTEILNWIKEGNVPIESQPSQPSSLSLAERAPIRQAKKKAETAEISSSGGQLQSQVLKDRAALNLNTKQCKYF